MRRASLGLVVLVPLFAFSCAQGNSLRRVLDDYDDGSGDDHSGEVDNETDPGSPESQGGSGGGSSEGDVGEECAHDPCVAGAPLDPSCSPCVADACAADSFCCESEWDDTCVSQATTCNCGGDPSGAGGAPGDGGDPSGDPGIGGSDPGIGGSDPGGDPVDPPDDPADGTCVHDVCLPGEPLEATCDPCAEEVCAGDDYCCTVEWDAFCVFDAYNICPLSCL